MGWNKKSHLILGSLNGKRVIIVPFWPLISLVWLHRLLHMLRCTFYSFSLFFKTSDSGLVIGGGQLFVIIDPFRGPRLILSDLWRKAGAPSSKSLLGIFSLYSVPFRVAVHRFAKDMSRKVSNGVLFWSVKHEIVRIIDDKNCNSKNEFQLLVSCFTNEMATCFIFDRNVLFEVIYKLLVKSKSLPMPFTVTASFLDNTYHYPGHCTTVLFHKVPQISFHSFQ